jgi:hypothetical protein
MFQAEITLAKIQSALRVYAGGVFICVYRAAAQETLPRSLSECVESERKTSGCEIEWAAAEQEAHGRNCKLYLAATFAIISRRFVLFVTLLYDKETQPITYQRVEFVSRRPEVRILLQYILLLGVLNILFKIIIIVTVITLI